MGKLVPFFVLTLILIERLVEVRIAAKNEASLRSRGAQEYDRGFTQLMFAFHGLWLVGFFAELLLLEPMPLFGLPVFFATYLLLQGLRIWCIASLGPYWNTKVILVPGGNVVTRGPYRFFRHPNYLIVLLELFLYPALLGCWFSAVIGGGLNVFVVRRRIYGEETALRRFTDYEQQFSAKEQTVIASS